MYHTNRRLYLRMIFLNESFSSALLYTSQPYAEVMAMRPAVPYIRYATYPREKTGSIIMFTHFVEGGYYQKLVTIRKLVTNMIVIKLLHH